jgi:hypothetical protein
VKRNACYYFLSSFFFFLSFFSSFFSVAITAEADVIANATATSAANSLVMALPSWKPVIDVRAAAFCAGSSFEQAVA